MFRNVPDCFKTQEMCEKAVMKHREMIEFVPDNFIKNFMFQQGTLKIEGITTLFIL